MSNPLDRITRSLSRRTDESIRSSGALRPWRIHKAVDAEEVKDDSITNLQIIEPANPHVSLEANANDQSFLEICRHYREGFYARPNIFTCEVPDAYCHVGIGMICTRDFKAINDSQMTYRMDAGPATVGNHVYRPFKWFKPLRTQRLKGTYATIGNVYASYWGHWIFDCLPRLYSLEKASAGQPVILLVGDDLPVSWRESLDAILPPNFEIQQLPANSWVQVERMLLASYPSGMANNHLPREFYDYVRNACFARFGLPLENRPTERIYISRAGARHRRVVNEVEMMRVLATYGFKSVALENLTFRQQVELFHRAEIVIAPDGSNCADMIFAGRIKIMILYSQSEPNTHWFTAAKGLGQQHFFLRSEESTAHSDFSVDLVALEKVLKDQMGLASNAG